MADSEPIDGTVLDALLETMGGDRASFNELIDSFLEDTFTQIAVIQGALALGDAEELRRAAHSIKSNSAGFGARRLSAYCKQLEERAGTGTLDGAHDAAAAVVAEFGRVKPALQAARPGA